MVLSPLYASPDIAEHKISALYELTNAAAPNLRPSWNIAPTQDADVIVKGENGLALKSFRWGLVPSWAGDIKIGAKMINARSETVAEKPAFRNALRSRRCIVPVSGFYEWQTTGKLKQPYLISSNDGLPMAFAGLWECWKEEVYTFSILTTAANTTMAALHDRMPVILERGDVTKWIEKGDVSLLAPAPDGSLRTWPVSPKVNKPAYNAADCIEPFNAV